MKKHNFLLISASLIFMATAEHIFEKSIFPPLPVAVLETGSQQCKEHSETYIQNLDNFTLWAYEMWDATSKTFSGVLRGNRFQLGHYEQCLTAEAPFLTKYCLAFLEANVPKTKKTRDPLSLYHPPDEHVIDRLYPHKDISQQVRNTLQVGWCIPASCSPQDLENYLNFYYTNQTNISLMAQNNLTYTARVSEITCSTKEENQSFSTADICFCSLSAILMILVIFTTIIDFNLGELQNEKPTEKPFLHRLLMSFSARKNFNDLTRADESNGALSILYGLRTVCIFFIILDHRFGTFTSASLLNFDYVERQYRAPLAPFIFHGDLFVDIFFIMGGLLVTFSLLNQFDKRKMNPGFIIMMRYIRLTPAYAFVIFYYATVYNYTGTGPFWKVVAGQESQDCKDNWWTNLLYINNYVNTDHMCMAHSWYLPCDFHFFIVTLVICLLIKKRRKLGLIALSFVTLISLIIPFAITIIYQRPALLYFYPEFLTGPKSHPDYRLTYIKSHTRATSYCIGIFVGYVYYMVQGKDIHLRRIKSHFLLIVSIVFMLLSLVGGAVFYNPYHEYNAIESATYAALHRPAFDLGIAGIIYISSYGHGGFLRELLTWSPWIPLSKLVYGAYLVHMQFQLRYASIFLSPRQFSYFDMINLAVADTVLSFLGALALYLMIEAPFRHIFRQLLMPNKVSPPQENAETRIRENGQSGSCDSRL